MTALKAPKPKQKRRALIMGIVFLIFAGAILGLFLPGTSPGQQTTFDFDLTKDETGLIGDVTFSTRGGLYAMAVLAAFAGAWQLAKGFENTDAVLGVVAGFFVIGFLTWAARDKSMNMAGMIRSSTSTRPLSCWRRPRSRPWHTTPMTAASCCPMVF